MENRNDNQKFSQKLNAKFKDNIKFSFMTERVVIIITKEDDVYEFKRNDIKNSIIAFSENELKIEEMIKRSKIEELSKKSVTEFILNENHLITRTENENHLITRTENENHLITRTENENHLIARTENGIFFKTTINKLEKIPYIVTEPPKNIENFPRMTCYEEELISFDDNFMNNGKYDSEFIKMERLGGGFYGEVHKCESKKHSNQKIYFAIKKCVKRIDIEEEDKKREFWKELERSPVISQLNNERIVKYFDLWLETAFENGTKNLFFNIQMELCDISLNDTIKEFNNDLNFFSEGSLTLLGYYISSEIFRDILEGVKYLHGQNPPIIHRDLNPWNIMLKIQKNSRNLIKIVDLGLATIHESFIHSKTDVGHINYVAPEVRLRKYNEKADIWSLGLVLQKIFNIDVNSEYDPNDLQSVILLPKYQNASDLSYRMTDQKYKNRPDCETILMDKSNWALGEDEFDYMKNLEDALKSLYNKESFIHRLLNNRFHILSYLKNSKYEEEFIEMSEIGRGSFGTVFNARKSKELKEYEMFAIKKMRFTSEEENRFGKSFESSVLIFNLNDERIINFIKVWFENDFIIENEVKIFNENITLYIQMESCDTTLVHIDEMIKKDSMLYLENLCTLLGYHLLSQMTIEMMKGLNYLHEKMIMHRDLRPENILFKNGQIKIADFCMAKVHDNDRDSNVIHSGYMGDIRFIAPEVFICKYYD